MERISMDLNRIIFKYIFYLTLKLRREWFIDELNKLNESQYMNAEELKLHQLHRLNALLEAAGNNTLHYKHRIPLQISKLEDLNNLPLVDKSEIRDNPELFMNKSRLNQRLKTSGGSTGAPITLLKDSVGMAQEMAGTWRGYSWAGVKIGDRQARFWGVPRNSKEKWRARLIDFVCNRTRITAFGFNDESFEKAFIRLQKFRPDYFYGYVSIITEFARYVIDKGLKGQIALNSVITTAEVLTDSDRMIIEEAFGAKVFDEYGCGEVGTIAHECEYGSMHLSSENVLVEILDEQGNPTHPGVSGELVVTDLTNHSMPLIRYRLKDFATLGQSSCHCGKSLPILQKVHGRQYDSLVNRQGEKFHGEFFLYIVEDARKKGISVDGIQFIQNINLDVDVKVVMKIDDYSLFSEFVKDRLRKDFDKNISVNVSRVSFIEREPSGKLRVVKGNESK